MVQRTNKHKIMKRGTKIAIAIVACFAIWFVFAVVNIAVGNGHGGGILVMIIVFSIIAFVWRKLVGKKDEKDEGDLTTVKLHVGSGAERIDFEAQLTQEEILQMSKVRKQDPEKWKDNEYELVKSIKKDFRIAELEEVNICSKMEPEIEVNPDMYLPKEQFAHTPSNVVEKQSINVKEKLKKTNWVLVLGIALAIFVIIGTIIFAANVKSRKSIVTQSEVNEQIAASTEDSFKQFLYDVLTGPEHRLDLGTPKEFDSLVKYDEETRRYLWEKANEYGLDVGDNYEEFVCLITDSNTSTNQRRRKLYDGLTAYGCDLGSFELFSQKLNNEIQRRIFYDSISEYFDIGSWEEFNNAIGRSNTTTNNTFAQTQWKYFSSDQYEFTYQYDSNVFNLVEKTQKNSHCVMKLQSPIDEMKSTLISVWDNPAFSSSYDPDFIASCQSVDQEMGGVIRSATKTSVGGVNALKSELKINVSGKLYYAAVYRIIHKKRMYMLNIYIPVEEYNDDKSFGDRCSNNFKFNERS